MRSGERATRNRRTQPRSARVLKLFREPFVEELWKTDLGFVSMGPELSSDEDEAERRRTLAQRSRHLEIFLDYVVAHVPVNPEHFMEERFTGTLSAGERILRRELVAFIERVPVDARSGPAWETICKALRRLGGDPT
jgi:hypothetical protein